MSLRRTFASVVPVIAALSSPSMASPADLGDQQIRTARPFSLLVETGWNSLAGSGVNASYNITPELALDLGAGLGLPGPKFGGRLRYGFLRSNLTPFIGAGFLYSMGDVSGEGLPFRSADPGESPGRALVASSPFVQAVAGLDWTTEGGFKLLVSAGYAISLAENLTFAADARPPTPEERQAWSLVTGGGIVASVAVGYAF